MSGTEHRPLGRDACRAAWARHARVEMALWVILAAFLVMDGLLVTGVLPVRREVMAGGGVLVLALMVLGVAHRQFRCPRCGRRFDLVGKSGWRHNSLARSCGNCGLKKGQCEGLES